MLHAVRRTPAVGAILLLCSFVAVQAADDEMVTNPFYKYWANCKKGSTTTIVEKTAFPGPEKNALPDGIDEKVITSTLLEVTPEHVVVQVVVTEREFLSTVESAPTKKTYPAKVKKAHLLGGLHGVEPKVGEESMDVLGKKLTCTTFSGTEKKEGTEVDHKIWASDKVPGGIVKHTRVLKQDGKVVADTTMAVKSYKMVE
jgi:hypothetical protein